MPYAAELFDMISSLTDSLKIGMLLIDEKGLIVYANSISKNLLNLDGCGGKKWHSVIPWLEWDRLFNSGSTQFYDFQNRNVVAEL